MIRKLRRKFIFVLMSVVTLILLAIFISMLLSASYNTRRMSEAILQQALVMQPSPQDFQPPQEESGLDLANMPMPNARLSVLVAEIDANGKIVFVTNQLYFIKEEAAVSIIQTAMNTAGNMGILNDYGLRWLKSEDGDRIALADISMEQEMLKNMIMNTLPIGGAALIAFFFISLFLARWTVRPVERSWARQRQFIADASHELKTPLTVILSNADMLSEDEVYTGGKKFRRLEHIQEEARRMKKLVEALLELARSDDAENIRIQERVDFSFIVTSAVLTFEPVIYDERKKISHMVRNDLFVTGDATRLQQLISILLDNAVKYCPKEGQILVDLKEGDKKTVVLTVINDGEPIPKEALNQIFERFYRIDKARSAPGSFGLGLSIAESIVREHGGKIWAGSDSETGNGFYVSLPLA